jgi:hypothetical protein
MVRKNGGGYANRKPRFVAFPCKMWQVDSSPYRHCGDDIKITG